jgi:DNA replication protein DnaC
MDLLNYGFGLKLQEADIRVQTKIEEIGIEEYEKQHELKQQQIIKDSNIRDRYKHAKYLLEQSGLGEKFFNRTFDSFDVNDNNEKAYMACRRVILEKSKGVLISGDNGIGKTHLIAALTNDLTTQGKYVVYGTVTQLMKRNDPCDSDFVCIDDLGKEFKFGYKEDDVKVFVFDLVNKLYEQNKGIVITTNLNGKQLKKKYGNAVVSRLGEMCEWVQYQDKDWRWNKPTDGKEKEQ